MIERFAAEKRQVKLAVSLHAATDDVRAELLPINAQISARRAVRRLRATMARPAGA